MPEKKEKGEGTQEYGEYQSSIEASQKDTPTERPWKAKVYHDDPEEMKKKLHRYVEIARAEAKKDEE